VPLWENPMLQNPMVRDIARFALGTLVVLALLFGVLRPAMRQIIQPPEKRLPAPEVDVTLIDPDATPAAVIALKKEPDLASQQRALASDAYEDRLRQAREAVKNDSKQVAQVVKDWVAADER
ncbi:MAG TPA: flagellar M-ring protein FliF, partial [Pseudoxanthomonas sp.]|nr:flagellar M-ring protein FliF [Pseudoxanthomonas sp.]